jgi:hypothetical protein
MASTAQVTHDQLVGVARKWLRQSCNCTVVITELVTYVDETPDAIGWKGQGGYGGIPTSILVECKTSLSDLKADLSKPFRDPRMGMGMLRYYLVPAGAFQIPDLGPQFQMWGVLEWTGKLVKVTRKSEVFQQNMGEEIMLLTSAMRRAHFEANGISCRFYTRYRFYKPKGRATVTLTERETCHGCGARLAAVGSKFCLKCQEIAVEDDCAPD